MSRKPKGWRGESARHAAAAKGVHSTFKTGVARSKKQARLALDEHLYELLRERDEMGVSLEEDQGLTDKELAEAEEEWEELDAEVERVRKQLSRLK